jgi:hypothetical protein
LRSPIKRQLTKRSVQRKSGVQKPGMPTPSAPQRAEAQPMRAGFAHPASRRLAAPPVYRPNNALPRAGSVQLHPGLRSSAPPVYRPNNALPHAGAAQLLGRAQPSAPPVYRPNSGSAKAPLTAKRPTAAQPSQARVPNTPMTYRPASSNPVVPPAARPPVSTLPYRTIQRMEGYACSMCGEHTASQVGGTCWNCQQQAECKCNCGCKQPLYGAKEKCWDCQAGVHREVEELQVTEEKEGAKPKIVEKTSVKPKLKLEATLYYCQFGNQKFKLVTPLEGLKNTQVRHTTNRHAEQEAYATGNFGKEYGWLLFVQNEWPCPECQAFFRGLSNKYSIVFLIVPPTGGYGRDGYLVETAEGVRRPPTEQESGTVTFLRGQMAAQLGHEPPQGCPPRPK